MGILHKKRELSSNDLGSMYECLFPEYVVRFTIYNNDINNVECFFWDNDGYNNRTGKARCLRSFLNDIEKTPKSGKNMFSSVNKIGKGYSTFEETDKAWTDFYNSTKTSPKSE